MLQISVVICTRNPRADYIQRSISALKNQTFPYEEWELLLIDNNSDRPVSQIVDISWQNNHRIINEPKCGKTFALLRAIEFFRGNIFLIVDDDNVLQKDYLSIVAEMSKSHPWLGAWSGSYIPEFESEPANELKHHLSGLVIDKLDRPYWSNLTRGSEALPPGAGMAVRREVALKWAQLMQTDPLRQMLGPSGSSPGAGDDADMALCSIELGMGTGRFPKLELTHLIPSRKLTLPYLKHLYYGQSYASVVINSLYSRSRHKKRDFMFHTFVFLYLWLKASNSAERAIRYSQLRGKLRAERDLKQATC